MTTGYVLEIDGKETATLYTERDDAIIAFNQALHDGNYTDCVRVLKKMHTEVASAKRTLSVIKRAATRKRRAKDPVEA